MHHKSYAGPARNAKYGRTTASTGESSGGTAPPEMPVVPVCHLPSGRTAGKAHVIEATCIW